MKALVWYHEETGEFYIIEQSNRHLATLSSGEGWLKLGRL